MQFVSVDGGTKRVAHTSGVIAFIGKEPIDIPVFTTNPDTGVESGFKGLKECAMAAGCIPFNEGDRPVAAVVATVDPEAVIAFEAEKAAFEAEKAAFLAAKTAAPAAAKVSKIVVE